MAHEETHAISCDHIDELHGCSASSTFKAARWMGEWAPLPTEIDLPTYEKWQQQWNQLDFRDGVVTRLWLWGMG